MSMDNYTIDKVIGEGSYGQALLCKEKATDEFVVIKQISFTNLTEQEREESRKETQILSYLHHPNIIGYRGSFLERNIFHIVMDYADDGDLGQKISECQDYFKEDQILHWFVQICLALKHLHDRKILHRDLKTQNVFMMKNDVVKLGDFGISKVLDHTTSFAKTSIGTPYYLSPEICEGKPYNAKSDIWSLGCVLYEMCTKKHPFDSNCINGLIVKIIRGKPAAIPKQYSSNIRSLIDQMLQKNASKRPSINQIFKIPYIKDKVSQLLTQTMARIEFSHTVFHGIKGGETPDVIMVPDKIEGDPLNIGNESQVARPKSKSKLAVRKSRIPTSQKSSRASVSRQKKIVTKEEIVQQKKAAVSAERQQVRNERAKKQQEEKKQLEIEQSKRQHVIDEQKQKKRERELKMAQLKKEERERQKHFESLEAPFKKIRKQSSGKLSSNSSQSSLTSPSTSQEDLNPTNIKASPKSSSDQKSTEKVKNSKDEDNGNDDLFEDDFITFDEEDENEQKEVEDLFSLAAVASDMKDNPPGEDEEYEEDREEERKAHETAAKFIFRGKELPISEKDPRSVRNESVRAFIEKNLGAEKFLAAYRLITEDSSTMNEDEFDKKLATILTSQSEMDFCPLIQQLVVSELVED
ncbi:hypothetical protein M9Y10_005299 [Tritrichomonas musculus]|uniref:non-specific serine/threonine protein kinase n=1 Tax=Tritrichomonas musculus TaxID=1915356 RepID=A0ABR2JLD7_9EUKA